MRNTTNINIIIISLILTITSLTACTKQSVGITRQNMPASTLVVLNHVEDCNDSLREKMKEADEARDTCIAESGGNCSENWDAAWVDAYTREEDCYKHIPMVSYACASQLQPRSREHDSDGDGLADYWEFEGGFNPCEPCSFGGTPGLDCDGDLDWDRDGVPNAQDSNPLCGVYYDGPDWHANPEALMTTYCI